MCLFRKKQEMPKDTFWHRKFGPVAGTVIVLILEFVQIAVISAAIIIPIRYFLVQPFYVKGASMEPNFYDHEYLIIDELSYRFGEPERGNIVVFRYPRDETQFFIKRVIGLPGETVDVSDGAVTIYNDEFPVGKVLEEPYIGSEQTLGKKRTELSESEYFVMGDNRGYSLDSRSFGPVQKDEIIGRVWFRGFPFNRVSGFPVPEYNF